MHKLIVMAAAIGVSSLLGVGFLAPNINLTVQELGVGEQDLVSPADNANVDFTIAPQNIGGVIENVITQCTIEFDQDLEENTEIFCKLTDINSNVVSEGSTTVTGGALNAGSTINVPTTDLTVDCPANGNIQGNNVQCVEDVKIVVLGKSVTA